MPAATHPSSRYERSVRPATSRFERSSFQGMSIIEGERRLDPTPAADAGEVRKQRDERRRRTSSLAQSDQIRDIIARTVEEMARKGPDMASGRRITADERLKSVLKEVKESGYSSERIFGLIGKPRDCALDDEEFFIPRESFVEGLGKLGYTWKDNDELEYIIARFDLNGDGLISFAEFQHYCYHEVPSVAWKAERQRLQKAAHPSGDDTAGDAAIDESRFDVKEIMYAAGPEVHKTSKLFWKQDVSATIALRYCSDLDVITMQVQDTESGEDYGCLYVSKADCAVDRDALEEAATLAVQTSDETTDEGKERIRWRTHWEFYSDYLVARLRMAEDGVLRRPTLARLHGDESSTLRTERPANLMAPRCRGERRSEGNAYDEFRSKVRSFQRDSRQARTSRQSAQELSSIVESALNEILAEG